MAGMFSKLGACSLILRSVYIAGNFRGIQFSQKGTVPRLRDLIFADDHRENVHNAFRLLFRRFNIHGSPVNHENHQIFTPHQNVNFPY